MSTFEWFLLIVVVIGVPLIVAVVVTLWTLEQARKRQRRNRVDVGIGVKRKAVREPAEPRVTPVTDVSRETSAPPDGAS